MPAPAGRVQVCYGDPMAKSRRRKGTKHDRGKGAGHAAKKSSRPKRTPHGSQPIRGRRVWLLRVAAAFLSPVIALLLLEAVLSIFGTGYPTAFFIESEQEGVLTTNAHFGWHYQQRALTQPQPCLVPVPKPEDTIRVFVLGGSAAMGTPDPSFGLARVLEVMLRSSFPDHRVEVINAAMRGINSHVVLPIARQCAQLEPDVFVVYVGNNEICGLYGPNTPVAFFGEHPGLIPVLHWIKQTRTGQLLRRVLRSNPEAYQKAEIVQGPEFFAKSRTAFDDVKRDAVYRNFETNLKATCRRGLEAGADVIVSTVCVNLRDFPPLGSLHRADLTAPQQARWEWLYRKAIESEGKSNRLGAIERYREAAAIDDHYAELHFRLARCALQARDLEVAKRHFALARDRDALQFRTDARLNDIVRDVASQWPGQRVRLVDAERALAASDRCSNGIPGGEFFYEYVHLRFDGDYELAKTLLPEIAEAIEQKRGLVRSAAAPAPTRAECAQALAFTAWDEVNTAAAMVKLTANPPFTSQLEHAERQALAEEAISSVMDRVDRPFVDEVIAAYHAAIETHPNDWLIRYNLGTFLHQLGRYREAVRSFEHVVQTLPHVVPYRVLLGFAWGKAGEADRAIHQFREALKRAPRDEQAREGLDWAMAMKQRTRPG